MNKSDLTPVDGLESLHAELRALIASTGSVCPPALTLNSANYIGW